LPQKKHPPEDLMVQAKALGQQCRFIWFVSIDRNHIVISGRRPSALSRVEEEQVSDATVGREAIDKATRSLSRLPSHISISLGTDVRIALII
jgi:hypothetical protein